MDSFDEIVDGIVFEPVEISDMRDGLKEDYDDRHVGGEHRQVAHEVIDEVVDDLRHYFGPGGFDLWVQTAPAWNDYVKKLGPVIEPGFGKPGFRGPDD